MEYSSPLCFDRAPTIFVNHGKDRFLFDPDPNLLYTKRKLAKQRAAAAGENIPTSTAIALSSVVSSEQTQYAQYTEKTLTETKRCKAIRLIERCLLSTYLQSSYESGHYLICTDFVQRVIFLRFHRG